MKKSIMALAAAMLSLAAGAVVPATHTLILTKKSGETVEYKFSEEPAATFSDTDMNITLALTGQKVSYPMAEVASLTVTPRILGAEDAVATSGTSFTFDAGCIRCAGLAPGSPVALYTIGGTLVFSSQADIDGEATVAVSSLSAGTYVVSAGNESFKFFKN